MDLFDFIKELRKGAPDVQKAQAAMKSLGWLCIIGGISNFIFFFLDPIPEGFFIGPKQYLYFSFIGIVFAGLLFLSASRGIRTMQPWGKQVGKFAIVAFITIIGSTLFMLFPLMFSEVMPDSNMLNIFFMIPFIPLALLGYFGVCYLQRLPIQETITAPRQYAAIDALANAKPQINMQPSAPEGRYKEALFPLGIVGAFSAFIAAFMFVFIILLKYSETKSGDSALIFFLIIFFPVFIFGLLCPALYNLFPSSFQGKREIIGSYTGGGSVYFFICGSWPFFKLIVYKDGLEIRFMFHRFFIPYNKMSDIPEKVGFFSTSSFLIKSELPEVPGAIRFNRGGINKVLKVINETRNKYLSSHV